MDTDTPYFLGLVSDDLSSNSKNPGNVYFIELLKEERKIFSSTLLHFGFDQTRCINSFLDFDAFKYRHKKIQRSYIDPGNPLSIYSPVSNLGVLFEHEAKILSMEYIVRDIFGNPARIHFNLRFVKGSPPKLEDKNYSGLIIPYSFPFTLNLGEARLYFPKNSLFDTLVWNSKPLSDKVLSLGNPQIPIKDSILFSWAIPKDQLNLKGKIYIRKENRAMDTWLALDSAHTWIKEFGNYSLAVDTNPPYIIGLKGKNTGKIQSGNSISLVFGDYESGLKSYNAFFNEHWILMEYDAKTRTGKIIIPNNLIRGKQNLKILLSDRCGNVKEEKLSLYF
jgi:hypothetical protein